MRNFAQIARIWVYLPVVEAVFQHKSFALAADHLAVNRTTVERRLRALEGEVGGSVFEKSPDGYTPTPLGREILRAYEAAREAFEFLEPDQYEETRGGPLRLTFPPHAAAILSPALLALASPEYDYALDLVSSYEIANLQAREADIAVRVTRTEPDAPLCGHRIAWLSGALYRPRDEIAVRAFILRPWETARPDYAPDWTRELPTLLPYDVDSQRELIAQGGIGRLPRFFAAGDERLRQEGDALVSEDWQLWVVTHRSFERSPRIRTAMNVLRDYLGAAVGIAQDPDPRNRTPGA